MAGNGTVSSAGEDRQGVLYGLAAYGMWGLVPIYFKAVAGVPPLEVLAHRVVWSVVILLVVLIVQQQLRAALAAFADPKTRRVLAATTVLIAVNWFVFIWAVANDHVLEASLGYFINPLVNVLLGLVFLRERLSRPAMAAVALAVVGVAIQTALTGRLPMVSLVLAVSFGFYGLLRKTATAGAVVGLAVETVMLLPAALAWLGWQALRGQMSFLGGAGGLDLLLVAAGAVTAVPLLAFTAAARRLRLSTMGFLQYLAPTGHFLLAVLAYDEPFDRSRLLAFAFIWTALVVFTADRWRTARRRATS
jgi:chloramphenicol-sensitive protein RarD